MVTRRRGAENEDHGIRHFEERGEVRGTVGGVHGGGRPHLCPGHREYGRHGGDPGGPGRHRPTRGDRPLAFRCRPQPVHGADPGGHRHLRLHRSGRGVPPGVAGGSGAGLAAGDGAAAVQLYLVLRRARPAGDRVPSGEDPLPRRVPLGPPGPRGAGMDRRRQPGAGISACWSSPSGSGQTTTATPTTWAGSTCSTGGGTRPSPSSSAT